MSRSGPTVTRMRIRNHRHNYHELCVVWSSTNSNEGELAIPTLEQGVYKSHMTVIRYSSLGVGNQSALSCFRGPKPCLGLAAATFWGSSPHFFAAAMDSAGAPWEEPSSLKEAPAENPKLEIVYQTRNLSLNA